MNNKLYTAIRKYTILNYYSEVETMLFLNIYLMEITLR